MRRSLIHYWRINLAVAIGAAVATAVLTGALMVGDSVRGSLRELTLDRLGKIDYALVADRFFRQEVSTDFFQNAEHKEYFENPVSAIIIPGSVTNTKTQRRASGINLLGIDQAFIRFFQTDLNQSRDDFFSQNTGQFFPPVVINAALQKELGASIGDHLLVAFQQTSEVHRETLLGSRSAAALVKTARFQVTRIIPDRGMGRFSLRPYQQLPLNVYVSLFDLQKALEEKQKINALFVSRKTTTHTASHVKELQSALRTKINLEDFGIAVNQRQKLVSVESAEIVLSPLIANAVESLRVDLKIPAQHVLTYLANTIQSNGRVLPYSTITAMQTPITAPFDALRLTTGAPAPALRENEILLNEWAAQDLATNVGDTVRVSYYTLAGQEQLVTHSADLRVAGIVALSAAGADPTLTPEFPGIHDAENMQSWDPPFPVDLNLIRPKDEAYWDRYRAAPKAFVSLATGQRLWSNRFGKLTSIRLGVAEGSNGAEVSAKVQAGLLDRINPEQMGFVFQPVKEQGLDAAIGATDFGALFVGFSIFLIASAALLVGMLFRLGVEQRAAEIGTLLAVGFPLSKVRRRLLKEGSVLAGAGCLLGLFGAIGYAWFLMLGLRTWWIDAIGSPFLFLHVNAVSLITGYVAAMVITLLSIWWSVRQLGKVPAPALLHGITTIDHAAPRRFSRVVALAAALSAVAMIAFAILSGATSSSTLFFGTGALALIAGLAFFSLWLRKLRRRRQPRFKFARLSRMAIHNGARNPGRSMLSAGLVCCACFIIVAVAANRRDVGNDATSQNSGTGGFALIAESDVPLHHDLNTQDGRQELGISDAEASMWESARAFPVRVRRGDDASCLNLYQPQQPRLLGAPPALIERDGFAFQSMMSDNPKFKENPWRLLEEEIEPGVIPAFGDQNSVRWILHLGLGEDFTMRNEFGQEIKLRFVGLLQNSIFQSEIIISESNFLKHFPSVSGYAEFFIEAPANQAEQLSQTLERALRDYGFDATSTREKLAGFQAVENTYLSVFQTLGGLGLLLGTVGLGIILMRNAIERRGELAALRAFGFRRSTLASMLLTENGFLILAGIFVGSASALIAVAPHLTAASSQVPWLSLSLTLLAVLLTGLIASALAASMVLRMPLLPALKAE